MSEPLREARKALTCLYIAVEKDVADDVRQKVEAAIETLQQENATLRESHKAALQGQFEALQENAALKAQLDEYKGIADYWIARRGEADTEITRLRQALTKAVETIRLHHGMGMNGAAERIAWSLYQSSPEMKQISQALEAPDAS